MLQRRTSTFRSVAAALASCIAWCGGCGASGAWLLACGSGANGEASIDGDSGLPSLDGDVGAGDDGAASDALPCDLRKSPAEDTCVLRDDLGVFASPTGDDAADGSRAHPVKSLGKALVVAANSGKRVYACEGEFTEALTLIDGVDVFGGVDCATFTGVHGRTRVTSPASPAISVRAATKGVHLDRIDATAPSGASTAAAGASSFVMLAVDAAKVLLTSCTLSASAGRNGADAEARAAATVGDPAFAGGKSVECPIDGSGGGVEGASGTLASAGGVGGAAKCASAFVGRSGVDAARVAATCGHGGAFDATAPSCFVGQDGCAGASGDNGAPGGALGAIDDSGYRATNAGGDARDGAMGGGGGGGSAGISVTSFGKKRSGGGGGGGGGGGFAGLGGKGGQAGGASIALISVRSSVRLVGCKLTAQFGGNGGNGGAGSAGGGGGAAGLGGASLTGEDGAGCSGGLGGGGGRGGDGGGGGGGGSIAIAYVGVAPTTDDATVLTIGAPGLGGSRDKPSLAGATGQAAQTLAF